MLKNFNNEDFEHFLKQNAEQLRLRPSENVWRNIELSLQRRRRRVIYTATLFLMTTSLFGYLVLENGGPVTRPAATTTATNQTPATASNSTNAFKKGTAATANRSTAPQTENKKLPASAPYAAALRSAFSLLQQTLYTPAPQALATVTPSDFEPTVVDEHTPFATEPSAVSNEKEQGALLSSPDNVSSIESVVNSFKPKIKRRRTEFQISFTPTISYRKLGENKSYIRSMPRNSSAVLNFSPFYTVNNVVTHKPDLGLELGMALKFPVTNRVKLRSGLQFNMNRYDIKAFSATSEIATITLNAGSRVDSVRTISTYRNFNGSNVNWLQNIYFQVSAPVGAEIMLSGNKHTRFGIATTIQPTYLLGDKAYLISSDYKNYSQVPSLTRRWNVNTTLETFVAYSTGKLKWQVGPQVRYQLLSSFDTKYPVKENLFDFGLKVGVSLNKPQ